MGKNKLKRGMIPAVHEPLSDSERATLTSYLEEQARQREAGPEPGGDCCAGCQNWLQRSDFGAGKVERGWCRALPPTREGWPQSYGDDWCFSFTPGQAPSSPGPREAQA